jgi:acetyl-CoA C-acetyltransferase
MEVEMREAVIVEAARTPIGRGYPIKGWLSGFHATEVLSIALNGVVERAGIDREMVEQVVSGTVTQAGEQSGNNARFSWLHKGDTYTTGCTTVDCQCGSAQQAFHMVDAFIKAGTIDIGIASGLEHMSHVGLGANVQHGPGFFFPDNFPYDMPLDQFEAVARICKKRGITREELDQLGVDSQTKAIAATEAGYFKKEIIPIQAPVLGDDGKPTGETRLVDRDQGLRESNIETLSKLKAVDSGGFTTAATSSQLSDGASAVLMMTKEKAKELGLKPRARIVQGVLVGSDPYYLLDGPVDATRALLKKTGMSLNDIDIYEVNEAFAGVALSWCKVFEPDMSKLNINGGAIAIGHPVGSTGTRLATTALHILERMDKSTALLTMCCGSAVATGTIIERL